MSVTTLTDDDGDDETRMFIIIFLADVATTNMFFSTAMMTHQRVGWLGNGFRSSVKSRENATRSMSDSVRADRHEGVRGGFSGRENWL